MCWCYSTKKKKKKMANDVNSQIDKSTLKLTSPWYQISIQIKIWARHRESFVKFSSPGVTFAERERERFSLSAFFRTEDIRVHIVHRKYKDYVYRKMLVQEYLKKWRIFKRVKPKNDMMYHDIYNCICPYKPFNHNLYIGIIIFLHIDNPQSRGYN